MAPTASRHWHRLHRDTGIDCIETLASTVSRHWHRLHRDTGIDCIETLASTVSRHWHRLYRDTGTDCIETLAPTASRHWQASSSITPLPRATLCTASRAKAQASALKPPPSVALPAWNWVRSALRRALSILSVYL